MKTAREILAVLISLCFLIVLFFTALQISIFDRPYVYREMRKYEIPRVLSMSEEGVDSLFDETLKYLSDDRDDLVIEVEVAGQKREAFDTREKLHMVDVKELFRKGFIIRNTAAGLLAVLFLVWLLARFPKRLQSLSQACVLTWGIVLLVFTVLVIYVIGHFDTAFIRFHEIFFDNDLWLLDPDVSLMINMLPEEFFFDTAMRIGLIFGIPFVLLFFGSLLGWRKSARHTRAEVRG